MIISELSHLDELEVISEYETVFGSAGFLQPILTTTASASGNSAFTPFLPNPNNIGVVVLPASDATTSASFSSTGSLSLSSSAAGGIIVGNFA